MDLWERAMARIASDERARSVVATLSVGPINGASFLACVDQAPLVPTLRPGVVVLKNLGSHKRPIGPRRRGAHGGPAALQSRS